MGTGSILRAALAMTAACAARAQTLAPTSPETWASNVVVPQCRAYGTSAAPTLHIAGVDAQVVILEQTATTTLDIHLSNPTSQRLEAELLIPVPEGSVVRGFAFDGAGAAPSAQVLPAREARRTYESIVARIKDPALLEFVGYNVIRSSVFPVEAGGGQRLRLTYEQVLAADGERVDYVLPRSEALGQQTPWAISVQVKSAQPVATVYSPSHPLECTRSGAGGLTVKLAAHAATEPGSFRLSYLKGGTGVAASLMAYPDARGEGGYFLLLAGLPELKRDADLKKMRREVTLVIDRSGSMAGEKLQQAKRAAGQVLNALGAEESFNIIVYSDQVESFSTAAVPRTSTNLAAGLQYIGAIRDGGGTNIHDALQEALSRPATPETVPLVLFLTDGLPTVGDTSELGIRRVVTDSNPHHRRVFAFGVGFDVNAPLLQKISADSRAAATFVLPEEDVEVKVASLFKKLDGPVLTDTKLVASRADASQATAVQDVIPGEIPDLFDGDQLVVLGRYVDGGVGLQFKLTGKSQGQTRTFEFTFPLEKATTRNAFIPRLWASRRIAQLVDSIRQMGADASTSAHALASARAHSSGALNAAMTVATPGLMGDARVRELVDEIVRLSTEFGILTEYTAFLAREGTDLTKRDAMVAEACGNIDTRAVQTRSGSGAVNQAENIQAQVMQTCSNYSNRYWDANMQRVEISNVQQISDRAFFQRGGRWMDSRLADRAETAKPTRVVEFGSAEFSRLLERLATQNRAGCVSLRGDVLLDVDGDAVLIRNPDAAASAPEAPATDAGC